MEINFDEITIKQGDIFFDELFSKKNESITHEGPFTKSEAVEKFKIYSKHTHPLYIVDKDGINFYLFY